MIFTIAQVTGLLGSGCTILAAQTKNKRNYLIIYTFAYVFLIISMILLKAYGGVANSLILMVLTFISSKYEDKKIPTWLMILFELIILLGTIIAFENIYSLLPSLASYVFLCILLSKNMKIIRRYTLLLKLLWATYDILIMAYATFVMDVLCIISIIIAMFRYDIKKKNTNI